MARALRPVRKTLTRHVDATGKRCPAGTPGATRQTTKTDTWYVKLDGVWVSLHTTDEAAAWDELRRLLRRRRDRESGIADDYTDHAATLLVQHVDAWIADVKAGGAGKKHRSDCRQNVLAIAEAAANRLPPP